MKPLVDLIDEHNRLAALQNSGSEEVRPFRLRLKKQIRRRKRNAAKRANL